MFFFMFQVLLAPVAVLGGTAAQRHFGHSVGGLIIGLPLTGLPLLWLIALQHGPSFAGSMTSALLVGSIAEVVVLWLYAKLAQRVSPASALVGSLSAFAVTASLITTLHLSAMIAGLLTASGFAIALRWWPSTIEISLHQSARSRLALRVALATVFTLLIVVLADRLGPFLSGEVDALPVLSLMMAYMTQREHDGNASSQFLRGVTRGSFSYVAAMMLLAELLHTGNLLLAFSAALGAALLVQIAIVTLDHLSGNARVQRLCREVAREDSLGNDRASREANC
jgi:uncharacterized membrane protein (GlpM family)